MICVDRTELRLRIRHDIHGQEQKIKGSTKKTNRKKQSMGKEGKKFMGEARDGEERSSPIAHLDGLNSRHLLNTESKDLSPSRKIERSS